MLLQVVSDFQCTHFLTNSLSLLPICTLTLRCLMLIVVYFVLAEYGASGQVSVAGDAYSFGITLLEMFTGRAPTDDMFREGLTLHLFAEMAFPDKIPEIMEPTLLQVQPYDNDATLDNTLASLASVIRIGISCSKQAPPERMSMKNAATELHRIRDVVVEFSAYECTLKKKPSILLYECTLN